MREFEYASVVCGHGAWCFVVLRLRVCVVWLRAYGPWAGTCVFVLWGRCETIGACSFNVGRASSHAPRALFHLRHIVSSWYLFQPSRSARRLSEVDDLLQVYHRASEPTGRCVDPTESTPHCATYHYVVWQPIGATPRCVTMNRFYRTRT